VQRLCWSHAKLLAARVDAAQIACREHDRVPRATGARMGRAKEKGPAPVGADPVSKRAAYQNRTDDLFITSESLYQLS
jgi:hypothetical protein